MLRAVRYRSPVQTLRGSFCVACWKVKGVVVDKPNMTERDPGGSVR